MTKYDILNYELRFYLLLRILNVQKCIYTSNKTQACLSNHDNFQNKD